MGTKAEQINSETKKVAVFKGTRVPVETLSDYIDAGAELDDFLNDYPVVSKEAAIRALQLSNW